MKSNLKNLSYFPRLTTPLYSFNTNSSLSIPILTYQILCAMLVQIGKLYNNQWGGGGRGETLYISQLAEARCHLFVKERQRFLKIYSSTYYYSRNIFGQIQK